MATWMSRMQSASGVSAVYGKCQVSISVSLFSRDGRDRHGSVCVVTCDCSMLQVSHAVTSEMIVIGALVKRYSRTYMKKHQI